MTACAFCGDERTLTREHVFPDWLNDIGLSRERAFHRAGYPNQLARDLGLREPFQQTIRALCAPCNNGWVADLDGLAQRCLPPFILDRPGPIDADAAGGLTAWVQKIMLITAVLSAGDPGKPGLPAADYRGFNSSGRLPLPLPDTRMWIGRRTDDAWSSHVVPMEVHLPGAPIAEQPTAWAFTLQLGHLLLTGLRFTMSTLAIRSTVIPELAPGLVELWPSVLGESWPPPRSLDGSAADEIDAGRHLRSAESPLQLQPWRPAVDLPRSRLVGSAVELPAACGRHVLHYPAVLAQRAQRGPSYLFATSCPCPMGYLIELDTDGARLRAAGPDEEIIRRWNEAEGDDIILDLPGGTFCATQLR